MRILVRLAALCAALLSLASIAVADDRPEEDERPEKIERPEKGDEEQAERPEKAAKPDKADKPEKDDDGEDEDAGETKGKAKDDDKGEDEDRAPHPHGGAPGQLKHPGEPAHPEFTTFAEQLGAAPAQGEVRIKLPASDTFAPLAEGQPVPVGTVVDATDGLVEIMSEASAGGVEQNAVVTGGVFRVDQKRTTGITDLRLQGGDFSGCKAGTDDGGAVTARAAASKAKSGAKRKGGQVARGIWAAGKGRFRTTGRRSAATVRGTRWATVDRCLSTTTKVFEGVVDVKDLETGRTITVRAGERHVARERRG